MAKKEIKTNEKGEANISSWLPGPFVLKFRNYCDTAVEAAKKKGEMKLPKQREIVYDFIKQGMENNPIK